MTIVVDARLEPIDDGTTRLVMMTATEEAVSLIHIDPDFRAFSSTLRKFEFVRFPQRRLFFTLGPTAM